MILTTGSAKSRRDFATLYVVIDMFLNEKLLLSPLEKSRESSFLV
jgi:hypothetical protein